MAAPSTEPIGARFTREDSIGRGSYGEVFRGIDRSDGSRVAIKRLHDGTADAKARVRFEREARLLAQIDHPHVVRAVAFGTDDEGRLALVLEWIDGEDLGTRRKRDASSLSDAIEVARQIATGLAALHANGIVHRDVKPSNILLRPADDAHAVRAVLIDLGVARGEDEAALTVAGALVGTPAYMAPEQARGGTITPRVDVYSLGVVLYELVTGRRAFAGDDPFSVLAKVLFEPPPAPSSVVPGLPAALDAVILRAIALDPADRFESARDFAEALSALAGESPIVSMPAATTVDERVERTELRVVTALFFSHDADRSPDARLDELVGRHAGERHELLGGRSVILFGSEHSLGDETERAARLALALRSEFPGACLSITTARASPRTALPGDAIDRGMLALSSAPGRIAIDDASARLLGPRFAHRAGERTMYLDHETAEEVSAAPGAEEQLPFTGRTRDLALLENTVGECIDESVARAVLVTAPAGAGKSRLLRESRERLASGRPSLEFLSGRGDPIAASSAHGLIGRMLRRAAGVRDASAFEEQRARFDAFVGKSLAGANRERQLEALAFTAGLGRSENSLTSADFRLDPFARADAIRDAWEAWVGAVTAVRPLVILLDDLHDADPPSVRLVDSVLHAQRQRPLCVLAFARPDVSRRFPDLWRARDVLELRLAPLAPRASEQIARAALGDDAPRDWVEACVARADGNPFFLEELARSIRSERARSTALPETVLATVQVRLDALGTDAKRVLRAASVFGEVFWRGAIEYVLEAGTSPSLEPVWDLLVRHQMLVQRHESRAAHDVEYRFAHTLLRECAHSMLTADDSRRYHLGAAAWLERTGLGDAFALAAHFDAAGSPADAVPWMADAADLALRGNDLDAAIAHARRACDLGAREHVLGRVTLVLAEASWWKMQIIDAGAHAVRAAQHLPRGDAAWFRALGIAMASSGDQGVPDTAREWIALVRHCDPVRGADAARIDALCRGVVQMIRAHDEAAVVELFDVIETGLRATAVGAGVRARVERVRGVNAVHRGDLSTALAHQRLALDLFREAHDARNAAQQQATIASTYASLGEFERAAEAFERALPETERFGLTRTMAWVRGAIGEVLTHLGDLQKGREIQLEVRQLAASRGERRLHCGATNSLAMLELRAGNVDVAIEYARSLVDDPHTPPSFRSTASALLSRGLLARGDIEGAMRAAQFAVDTLRTLGAQNDDEGAVTLAHAEALDASGNRVTAARIVSEAADRLHAAAARISDPALAASFLERVPNNARVIELAREWRPAPEENTST